MKHLDSHPSSEPDHRSHVDFFRQRLLLLDEDCSELFSLFCVSKFGLDDGRLLASDLLVQVSDEKKFERQLLLRFPQELDDSHDFVFHSFDLVRFIHLGQALDDDS